MEAASCTVVSIIWHFKRFISIKLMNKKKRNLEMIYHLKLSFSIINKRLILRHRKIKELVIFIVR